MTRRNTELVLLLLAAPIVILLFAMMVLNDNQTLSVNTLGVPLGIFAAFLVAHLSIRKLAPSADPAILPIVFALSGIGIAFVTRLAPDLAVRQVIWLFAGVLFMIAILALVKNIDKIANYKYTLMFFGVILLLSPLVPGVGQEIYGSRIWLSIAGISFQPGEIAKLLIVLFLAGYLAQNREMLSVFTVKAGPFSLPDMRTILPLLIMWGISMVIVIFEKDLGSACVVFLVFLVMLYVASGKKSYLVFGLVMAAIGGVAAFLLFSHVQVRVDTWLDPFADASGTGYQLVQSLFSLADGGMFGQGIGRGMAESIPVVESDFIFSAIGEETGLLGAVAVLLLFLCLAVRGLIVSARAKSDVSSFIALGLTSITVLQAFIIVGGVTRLIPLTGLTLPFISQGGSSLLASFIAVGFLLRCGDQGTGLSSELTQGTGILSGMGVLGRVSLGKRLTNVMIAISILFALLIANLTLIMVVQADDYKNMSNNNHTIAKQAKTERGTISTEDGTVLARSVYDPLSGYYNREYPAGNLASHVVGYCSETYGTSGIESSYNKELQGTSSFATWTDVINAESGIGNPGNDVTLTIDSELQKTAQEALEGYSGSCIVMDPKTGAVLAMASTPTYDAASVESILASGSGGDALYNRAVQGLYIPGSTFKMLTLATAFEDNVADENTVYSSPGQLEIDGGTVRNFDGNSYGDITLSRAMELSSNTVFGQVGGEIGAERLIASAEAFGFNTSIAFDLPLTTSVMPDASEMTKWETAWAACGQPVGEHSSPGPQATVLQMALIGCAIANDGAVLQPYLVDGIYNANGERSYSATPKILATPISSDVAKRTRAVMEGVITEGTGTAAAISGVNIAGKTGTAETGKPLDDSWFVGMGPTEDCDVVVAVVLEQSGEGISTERAQSVLSAALQYQGD